MAASAAMSAFGAIRQRIRKKVTGVGNDGRFFSGSKRGEIPEIKQELQSSSVDSMKDAVKKVIAGLTVGKDMSEVFPDVLNCIRTENIEIKKLVYLYLINYAKSNPDLAILAVNAFVKDSTHPNPLIRALAVRTMGCIRVERITEYLGGPLKKALTDDDPYVRKTAAICVAKLHDISPPLVRDQGFLEMLRDLLSDGNATVVANAVAALAEIQDSYSTHDIFNMTSPMVNKLLAALNECTEWGQVFILDALAKYYTPVDGRDAENIIERILPRLKHQNSAVVLSAVKVVMLYMAHIANDEAINTYRRKLAPPLVTLAQSQQPEVQFVALRNIELVVQKQPGLLSSNIKAFFCKYNDPVYVKMVKLEILVKLVNERNVEQVLLELKEYAQEVDVEYVRRAVRTIGRCAIKLESAAERCIKVLLQLIRTQVNYVVQEAIVVIKDIFRKYPNRYEAIISVLCESLDRLDEPEAKASMVWIIGEYADRIENADQLIDSFVDGFHEETAYVQLAILTAAVKLFLVKPDDTQELVQRVLQLATEESDNPDLRDRGFVYWRLLSTDPDAARAVVLAEKPSIQDDTNRLEPELLQTLLQNMGTLASVYHKPAEAFVKPARAAGVFEESDSESDEESAYGSDEEASVDLPGGAAAGGAGGDDLDILGLDLGGDSAPTSAPSAASSGAAAAASDDLFDLGGSASSTTPSARASSKPARTGVFTRPALQSKAGLTVHAAMSSTASAIVLKLGIVNEQSSPVNTMAVAINKNGYGLTPSRTSVDFGTIASGSTGSADVPLRFDDAKVAGTNFDTVDVALRDNNSKAQVIFKVPADPDCMFTTDGQLEEEEYIAMWRSLSGLEEKATVRDVITTDLETTKDWFRERRLYFVTRREGPPGSGQFLAFFSARLQAAPSSSATGSSILVELTFKEGVTNMCQLKVRSGEVGVSQAVHRTMTEVLQGKQ